jgi:hypothetical protein
VTVAGSYAAWADEARARFLPGISVDAAYAIILAGSVLAGRPVIGTVHDWLLAREVLDCSPRGRVPRARVSVAASAHGSRLAMAKAANSSRSRCA